MVIKLLKRLLFLLIFLLSSSQLKGDHFYYTKGLNPRPKKTTSKVPHLPVLSGYVSTNNTYRFFNIAEQGLTMIGEGKHGLWRIQDNGMIREYRKKNRKVYQRVQTFLIKKTSIKSKRTMVTISKKKV